MVIFSCWRGGVEPSFLCQWFLAHFFMNLCHWRFVNPGSGRFLKCHHGFLIILSWLIKDRQLVFALVWIQMSCDWPGSAEWNAGGWITPKSFPLPGLILDVWIFCEVQCADCKIRGQSYSGKETFNICISNKEQFKSFTPTSWWLQTCIDTGKKKRVCRNLCLAEWNKYFGDCPGSPQAVLGELSDWSFLPFLKSSF